jgi:dienelactone hydrolase
MKSFLLFVCLVGIASASVSRTYIDFNFNKIFATSVVPAVTGPVSSSAVNYDFQGTTFQGYLFSTSNVSNDYQPAVLLLPDADGITAFAKSKAAVFAQAGYLVFLADLYGRGVTPASLTDQTTRVEYLRANPTYFRGLVSAAYSVLANQMEVDTSKLFAVGYGIGGTAALEAVRAGIPVSAAVILYGDLRTISRSQPGDIKASLLFLQGSLDSSTPPTVLSDLQSELNYLKVDWEWVTYGNAYGYFSNPSYNDATLSRVYNQQIDARSQKAALRYLSDHSA